jgi:hypothetical protein
MRLRGFELSAHKSGFAAGCSAGLGLSTFAPRRYALIRNNLKLKEEIPWMLTG